MCCAPNIRLARQSAGTSTRRISRPSSAYPWPARRACGSDPTRPRTTRRPLRWIRSGARPMSCRAIFDGAGSTTFRPPRNCGTRLRFEPCAPNRRPSGRPDIPELRRGAESVKRCNTADDARLGTRFFSVRCSVCSACRESWSDCSRGATAFRDAQACLREPVCIRARAVVGAQRTHIRLRKTPS